MSHTSFIPPRRTLMGPGPSHVHERVLNAMARPTIGHLDPEFIRLMDEIKQFLQALFKTENNLTLPVSAPGSAGQETCMVNLLEPGDKCVICINGVFGGRLKMMAERAGAQVVTVDQTWGRAIDPDALEKTLAKHPDAKLVAFVHAETSTGVLSDAQAIAAVAKKHDCLVVADTVTSLGGVPVLVDEWGLDAVYSGTQKCLSCPPGLSPVTFSAAANEAIAARKTPSQSWFLDLSLLTGYWTGGAQRAYHHTAPVNALYGLHEALLMLSEEGLENAWQRHSQLHLALVAGFEAMGLGMAVPADERTPQLNTVEIPDGIDEAAVRKTLLLEHNLEIGAGLGPMAGKIWRIGLMGQSCTMDNVTYCLETLEKVLQEAGAKINVGDACEAAKAATA